MTHLLFTESMKVSIKDIAQALNLSKATVSWILSGQGPAKGFSDTTIKRVKDYAESVNYRPNLLARSLSLGTTNTIGLIIPFIGDTFYAQLVQAIESEAARNKYVLIVCSSEGDGDKEYELVKMLRSKQVDGIVIAPTKVSRKGVTDSELLSRALLLAENRIKERDRHISVLEEKNAQNAIKLSRQAPKVRYFEEVLHSASTYTTTQIAKELGMSGKELNYRLKLLGVQFRQSGTWMLTARYHKEGYTRTHTHVWQNRNGETGTAMHTVWTERGRLFIHQLLNFNIGY